MIKEVPIGEVVEIARNGLPVKQFDGAGGLPITRIETISKGEIDRKKVGYAGLTSEANQKWLLQDGDLLISNINSMQHLGKCAIYEGHPPQLIHGMNLLGVRPRQEMALPRYMMHFFKSHFFLRQIPKIANQSVNQSSFSVTNFKTLVIPLPPLSEQKRIAAILDKADAIRKKRKQAIGLTEDFLRSAFLEMFGDPFITPKKWELGIIGDVSTLVTSGLTPRGGAKVYVDDGPYFIRSQNVLMNFLDLSGVACIPEEVHSKMQRTKVAVGDVLLNITGASLGRVAPVLHLNREANVNQHVCIIRPNTELMDHQFLSAYLSLPSTQKVIGQSQAGAAREGLNHQKVRALPIPLPPLSMQRAFCRQIESRKLIRLKMEQMEESMELLFKSLEHKAFNGEL